MCVGRVSGSRKDGKTKKGGVYHEEADCYDSDYVM